MKNRSRGNDVPAKRISFGLRKFLWDWDIENEREIDLAAHLRQRRFYDEKRDNDAIF